MKTVTKKKIQPRAALQWRSMDLHLHTPASSDFQQPEIRYLDILNRGLKVMDSAAISLCMDNRLPLVVFNVNRPGNLVRVVQGEPVGTVVKE